MTLTLLLDLDDTLLNTNVAAFTPAYFQGLAKALAPHTAPEIFYHSLISGMQLMTESEDFSRTLQNVFDPVFFPQIGVSRQSIEPTIQDFYDTVFPTLAGLTTQKPDAKPFVDWAFSRGFRIAIATDPLLPRKAAFHRLRWAGFEPEQFELVSDYEHFHFSKTHATYYAEFLGRMGWPEGPVLMVGNDMERDIRPAQMLGLATFQVDEEPVSSFGPEAGLRGKLSDLRLWLESTDLSALTPSFKTKASVMAILAATPAALNGLTRELESAAWSQEPMPDDWAMTELICHLRDTEREVHHLQIKLFKDRGEPFIPRPDTSVWASRRDYLHEDGVSALKEFNEARRETMTLLKNVAAENWENKARHAIFGPTSFLEVVGFIAEHDRLHIQQAWSILKKF